MSGLWWFASAVGVGSGAGAAGRRGGAAAAVPVPFVWGQSHVLLPVFALLRRADVVTVIGAALAARAAGAGVRTIAAAVGRPAETVRGWLRRFAGRAEEVRVVFTGLLVAVGVDPVPPVAASSVFADAVAAVAGASAAVASRWPDVGEVPPWLLAVAISGGRLLAPGWPGSLRNTSCLSR